jgi:hypothetical protein
VRHPHVQYPCLATNEIPSAPPERANKVQRSGLTQRMSKKLRDLARYPAPVPVVGKACRTRSGSRAFKESSRAAHLSAQWRTSFVGTRVILGAPPAFDPLANLLPADEAEKLRTHEKCSAHGPADAWRRGRRCATSGGDLTGLPNVAAGKETIEETLR